MRPETRSPEGRSATKGARRRVITLAKVAVACITLFWLFSHVDLRLALAALRSGSPASLLAGIALLLLSFCVLPFRLHTLAHQVVSDFKETMSITFIGLLFNQILPGGVGGDGYRVVRLKMISERWSTAVRLIAFERVIGSLVLIVPGAILCAMDQRLLTALIPRLATASVSISWLHRAAVLAPLVLLAVLLSLSQVRVTVAHYAKRVLERLLTVVGNISTSQFLGVVGLSILFQGFRLAGLYWLLSSLGQQMGWAELVVVLSLTLLVSAVPISVGSWGIREGVIVFALGAFHVPHANALVVALLNRCVLLGVAGIGAGFLVAGSRGKKRL